MLCHVITVHYCWPISSLCKLQSTFITSWDISWTRYSSEMRTKQLWSPYVECTVWFWGLVGLTYLNWSPSKPVTGAWIGWLLVGLLTEKDGVQQDPDWTASALLYLQSVSACRCIQGIYSYSLVTCLVRFGRFLTLHHLLLLSTYGSRTRTLLEATTMAYFLTLYQ